MWTEIAMETINSNSNHRQEYVGSVYVNPVAQEVIKTIAGGMIAVSSGILFFWIENGKGGSVGATLMLCTHVLAIPLLAMSKILYSLYDGYERVSAKTNDHLEFMLSLGVGSALIGYLFVIYEYNSILAWMFLLSCLLALRRLFLLNKEIDGPHMQRRNNQSQPHVTSQK